MLSFCEVLAQFEEQLWRIMIGCKLVNISTSPWSILQLAYG